MSGAGGGALRRASILLALAPLLWIPQAALLAQLADTHGDLLLVHGIH